MYNTLVLVLALAIAITISLSLTIIIIEHFANQFYLQMKSRTTDPPIMQIKINIEKKVIMRFELGPPGRTSHTLPLDYAAFLNNFGL